MEREVEYCCVGIQEGGKDLLIKKVVKPSAIRMFA